MKFGERVSWNYRKFSVADGIGLLSRPQNTVNRKYKIFKVME